jgi:predicted hydrocarbon binding protein
MAYVENLLKRLEETSYFLTACFLNRLFSGVKNQYVREIRCVAAGDPYCEWEVK